MTDQAQASTFWRDAYDGAKEESSGGIIGRGLVRLAYVVYAEGFTGDDQERCIFVPAPGKDGRKKALKTAQAFAVKNGLAVNVARWHLVTTIYQNEAMRANGKDVTWQGDRLEKVPLWTLNQDKPSAAQAVMAALEEHGVQPGKAFYARFGWTADPYKLDQGVMDGEDQEGNPRYKQICVVQEVFANKEAAAAAVGSGDNGSSSSSYPWTNWPGDTWANEDMTKEAADFEMALADYEGDDFAEFCEEETGENAEWSIRLLSVGGKSRGEIVTLTGLDKKVVKTALKS